MARLRADQRLAGYRTLNPACFLLVGPSIFYTALLGRRFGFAGKARERVSTMQIMALNLSGEALESIE